jgi:hypothetical protein
MLKSFIGELPAILLILNTKRIVNPKKNSISIFKKGQFFLKVNDQLFFVNKNINREYLDGQSMDRQQLDDQKNDTNYVEAD